MATKPQFYIEYKLVSAIDGAEKQLLNIANQLGSIKTSLETIKATVDADVNSTDDMVTLAGLANTLVNNTKYTGLITYLQSNLG